MVIICYSVLSALNSAKPNTVNDVVIWANFGVIDALCFFFVGSLGLLASHCAVAYVVQYHNHRALIRVINAFSLLIISPILFFAVGAISITGQYLCLCASNLVVDTNSPIIVSSKVVWAFLAEASGI